MLLLRSSFILLLFHLFSCTYAASTAPDETDICARIETSFLAAADQKKESEACRCFSNGQTTTSARRRQRRSSDVDDTASILDADTVWIGCTRQKMPSIHRALNSLNETHVARLWIWDSLMTVVPEDIFGRLRPRTLSIENAKVNLFRDGAFRSIGTRLRTLHLKKNIIRAIPDAIILAPLARLEHLDLSANKIDAIRTGALDPLADLVTLDLSDNSIINISDGAFARLKSLRRLNLAHNGLTTIGRDTFAGLDALEYLSLKGNHIRHIDASAFDHMRSLKTIDLGTNKLEKIELRRLDHLEDVFINNNSIQSLRNVSLRDLNRLALLSLDRNSITRIADDDFRQLASTSLRHLSLAANQIASIDTRAFEPLHQLETLSLQNNQLINIASVFQSLGKLKNLFLASNRIDTIDDRCLTGLGALEVLALDHNELVNVSASAFTTTPHLTRLYLNRNRLRTLPRGGLFGPIESNLYVIDLSDNDWQCDCESRWLAVWMRQNREQIIGWTRSGCIVTDTALASCSEDRSVDRNSAWITALGILLGVVSVLICAAIVVLWIQDTRIAYTNRQQLHQRRILKQHAAVVARVAANASSGSAGKNGDLRRVPSDMVTLIPSNGGATTTVDKKRVRFNS